jgi:hypothetical protein
MVAGYPHEVLEEEAHPDNPTLVRYHYLPEVQEMLEVTGGMKDSAFWTRWHPIEPSPKAVRVGTPLTEAAYHAYWMGLAKEWIVAHPADFVRLALRKAMVFWQPSLHPSIKYGAAWSFGNEGVVAMLARWSLTAYVAFIELLAIIGLAVGYRKRIGTIAPLLIVMAAYTLMHMLFVPYTKYRIPLDALVATIASIAIIAPFHKRPLV